MAKGFGIMIGIIGMVALPTESTGSADPARSVVIII